MRHLKLFEDFKVKNITIDDIINCIQKSGSIYTSIVKNLPENDSETPLKPVSVDEGGLVTVEIDGSEYEVDLNDIERIEESKIFESKRSYTKQDRDKVFESFEEETAEVFSSILIDAKIVTIPHDKHQSVNLYVLYGNRIEHDSSGRDHSLLKEIYHYRSICREIYNKEYFRIVLTDSKVVIILYDYMDKDRQSKNEWRVRDIRLHNFMSKIPNDIYRLLEKDGSTWKGYSCLQPGIRYSNGDSGNLALFDWQYQSNESNIIAAGMYGKLQYSDVAELKLELEDALIDLRDDGFNTDVKFSKDYKMYLYITFLDYQSKTSSLDEIKDYIERVNKMADKFEPVGIYYKIMQHDGRVFNKNDREHVSWSPGKYLDGINSAGMDFISNELQSKVIWPGETTDDYKDKDKKLCFFTIEYIEKD